jgi:hypothetical protein
LVRVPACHAGGRGFEPRPPRQCFEKAAPEKGRLFGLIQPIFSLRRASQQAARFFAVLGISARLAGLVQIIYKNMNVKTQRHLMQHLLNLFDQLPLSLFIIAALAIGLAPFFPEPHLVEKLRMAFAGTLVKPVDIFDLVMHAAPVALLVVKLARMALKG